MAQSYLLFDFGSNEETAQQARRTIERWRQSFRLDKKLMLKFDREEPSEAEAAKKESTKAAKKAGQEAEPAQNERIIMMVRLDFSDHERLSYQRWLARVPAEEPFKDAHPKVISQGDPKFAEIAERFEGGSGRAHGFSGSGS